MKKNQKSEHGGAGVKLLLIGLVLFLIGHAGYQFIPVAYNGESFKQEMQAAVMQGFAVPQPGVTPADVVKTKLRKAAINNDIPFDAFVEVKQVNNTLQAHVIYTKSIPVLPFGIYNYNYHFDHIVTPSGFLTRE